MPQRVQITALQGPNDILYIEGMVAGVPIQASVPKAALEGLTKAQKQQLVAQALGQAKLIRQRSPWQDLLGELDIPDPAPGGPGGAAPSVDK